MSKKLVAYFSASGVTEGVAKKLAKATGADIFEIKPVTKYTEEDLNWRNSESRSSVEMKNRDYRPPVSSKVGNMEDYSLIFVGFPIWWYVAPTIINTFLEDYNLSGKTIIIFATSGGSPMGKTIEELKDSCPLAKLVEGRIFKKNITEAELKAWAESLKL
ncbi:MAG: flavodoxin [Clostridiales bacterium]|jgi:flavodoxin|nr:flavodoxin [Clostridiales bacterium]